MALSGVRISWLILARKSDFADEALSASFFAVSNSSSAFFHSVRSRKMAQRLFASGSAPIVMNTGNSAPPALRPITSRRGGLGLRVDPLEDIDRDALAVLGEQARERQAQRAPGFRSRTGLPRCR